MTGERAVRTVQLVGATALITSVFWLLMGAMVWPYATATGEIALPGRFAREAAATSVLPGDTAASAATPGQAAAGRGGERQLIIPVAGVGPQALIDTYSQAREEGLRRHDAIDIPAREGTPVVAAAAGTVEKLFRSESGGNTIYVRSRDGRVMFYYAHLQGYAPGLAEGQVVRPGDALGAVGWTGNADVSAPHLHFALWAIVPEARWWEGTAAINPYPLLLAGAY
jgi:peptidoglycan LD-endopeptidase LytH